MSYQIPSSPNSFHKTISHEQLNQIIIAIADGRYSWACVLILRFIGYNPLHFIPQRTYSRLIKENRQINTIPISSKNNIQTTIDASVNKSSNFPSSPAFNKVSKHNYLHNVNKKSSLKDSDLTLDSETKFTEIHSLKFKKFNK